jgi:hypothetical protein
MTEIFRSECLHTYFRWEAKSGGTLYYFVRKFPDNMELELLDNEEVLIPVCHTRPHLCTALDADYDLYCLLQQDNKRKPLGLEGWFRKCLQTFRKDPCCQITDPPAISWNKDEPCFKYFDPDILKQTSAPTPAWEEFLVRMTPAHREIFQAWVGGLFDPANKSRQVLWITGKGGDGKSVVCNVLCDAIGCAARPTNGDFFENRFFTRYVYGGLLVVVGDNTNPRLIQHRTMHNLTGGDAIQIEGKGMPSFRGSIYAHVLVCGNINPQIESVANLETRLLHVQIVPPATRILKTGDNNWRTRLSAEFEPFLSKCWQIYKRRATNGCQIELSEEEDADQKVAVTSEIDHAVHGFIDACLNIGKDFTVPPCDLNRRFNEWIRDAGLSGTDAWVLAPVLFKRLLAERGIGIRRLHGKNAYVGCSLKN